jgi:hypothetical protein
VENFRVDSWTVCFHKALVNSTVFEGKRRIVYEVCETDDVLQAEARRTDIHADSFNLTGDGSVDKYGHLADKHKTGGWRAAPLIFGTLVLDIVHHINLKKKSSASLQLWKSFMS